MQKNTTFSILDSIYLTGLKDMKSSSLWIFFCLDTQLSLFSKYYFFNLIFSSTQDSMSTIIKYCPEMVLAFLDYFRIF